jgi:hypothetical protein
MDDKGRQGGNSHEEPHHCFAGKVKTKDGDKTVYKEQLAGEKTSGLFTFLPFYALRLCAD